METDSTIWQEMTRSQSRSTETPVILVVDDQTTMLTLVEAFLRRSGYANVTVCSDVASARAHLEHTPFDLVISDIQMEPETGLDLLFALRADPKLAVLPVILMTSSLGLRQMREARGAGADAYLTKPFTAETLKLTVEQVLDDRAQRPEQP